MKNQSNVAPQKQKNRLPIIAFMLGLTPLFWWLRNIPFLGSIFGTLFIVSYFSLFLQAIALILGTIVLCRRKRHIGLMGLIFSILAILSPFIWGFILYMGAWEYIFSYK